jgi:hypothetical protein
MAGSPSSDFGQKKGWRGAGEGGRSGGLQSVRSERCTTPVEVMVNKAFRMFKRK